MLNKKEALSLFFVLMSAMTMFFAGTSRKETWIYSSTMMTAIHMIRFEMIFRPAISYSATAIR